MLGAPRPLCKKFFDERLRWFGTFISHSQITRMLQPDVTADWKSAVSQLETLRPLPWEIGWGKPSPAAEPVVSADPFERGNSPATPPFQSESADGFAVTG
ncbi:MAG: hypothetical protein CMH69_04835 [Nitratireductor sp.]|nr:hypothetical protein [Nitratireductor sp.]